MIDFKLRYNTEVELDSDLYWRVLINGKQYLASNVIINVSTTTTMDFLEDINKYKHHISGKANKMIWNGTVFIVE